MRISRIDVWKTVWGHIVEVFEYPNGEFVVNQVDNWTLLTVLSRSGIVKAVL